MPTSRLCSNTIRPLVGITMGDPVGIGPEIIVRSLQKKDTFKICRPIVIGDEGVILRAIDELKAGLTLRVIKGKIEKEETGSGEITVFNPAKICLPRLSYGIPDTESSKAMAASIQAAVKFSLGGKIDAVTTAPINKEALRKAGYHYPGHTEFLKKLTGAPNSIMMLAGDNLKVVLVTTHCPFKEVANLLTPQKIFLTIKIAYESLQQYFGMDSPKIAVAALNPHGGEGGIFGDEEARIISPAVKKAINSGINAMGPLPSDSLFHNAAGGKYDLVVCMYHDQGLIPLKQLDFHTAVNITLGLPIIRTSPDHGTAYDIAGKGKANPSSMLKAIELAARMAKVRANLSKK